MQTHLFAYYHPRNFNERDEEARKIAAPFTLGWVGSGTMLETGERDIQWRLKDGCEELAQAALRRAGFRVTIRELDI